MRTSAYSQDLKQISVIKDISKYSTQEYINKLTEIFKRLAIGVFGDQAATSVRWYRTGRRCRLTVVFKEKQSDLMCGIVNCIAEAALASIRPVFGKPSSKEYMDNVRYYYRMYNKGQVGLLRKIFKEIC